MTIKHKWTINKDVAKQNLRLDLTIRKYREDKGLSGASLCRLAGDLNPKTLTAVEKGRIKNPSMTTLLSIARGLSVSLADLFKSAETNIGSNLSVGSQKGAFQMDFQRQGIKMTSFTPLTHDFFCGKLLVAPKKELNEKLLNHPHSFYVSVLIGRFNIKIGTREFQFKEGENVFFNGAIAYSFFNPLHRESVLFMVTAPSFFNTFKTPKGTEIRKL